MNVRIAAALSAALFIVGCGAASAQAATSYPVVYNMPAGIALGETVQPTPLGANDWTCRPSPAHPDPVVLVPGLRGDAGWDFQAASPLLADNGYCVFAFDFKPQGSAAIETVAGGLSSFVDRVLSATGASKVDLLSHSEGGVVARYYLQFLGGAGKVDALAAISPLSHGTTLAGTVALLDSIPGAPAAVASACPACAEQGAGSSFMQKLNAGGDTVPGVRYTIIGTRYEEVITPYQSQFLSGPGVRNILLQDQCPIDYVDHLASIYDSIALHDALNAFDPAHATRAVCRVVLPGVGG